MGVLLHVLLTGSRPYGASHSATELEHAVLHDEPVRASIAVERDIQAIAATRSMPPSRLRRALAGDLDNIIAKALQKAPVERYATVLALSDDIERHLLHQPIFARSESVFVRARKFARRHRFGVAASVFLALTVFAGATGIVWQAQLARTEARKATAIKDFVVGIFERNSTAHPDGARARATTAEELLQQATQEIREGLQDAPEVRTELLGTIATLYSNMAMHTEALPLLQDRLESQRRTLGASHFEIARTLAWMALAYQQSGDYSSAVRSAAEAQEIFRATRAESALEYAQTYKILGHANYRLGNLQGDSLRQYFQTGLDLIVEHHPHNGERLSMLEGLSRAEQAIGNHERALELLQESVRLVETGTVEVDGIQRGGLYQSLGDRLSWAQRYDEAERSMRKAIAEYERAGGADHPYASDGKRALAMQLAWMGRREEAKDLLQSAFDAQQRVRGEADPQLTAVIRHDLGRVLVMRGQYAEGERHLTRLVEIWRASGAPILVPMMQLARIHTEQGRFDVAEQELKDIEEGVVKVFGKGSWMHATALNRLGALYLAKGEWREALRYFKRTDQEAQDPPGQLGTNRAYALAALLRIALDQADASAKRVAQSLLERIEASTMRVEMPDEEAAAHMLLGMALLRGGEVEEARSHLEQAVAMRERMDAPESLLLAEARLHLAQQRLLARDTKAAHALIQQAAAAQQMQAAVAPQHRALLADLRRKAAS